MRLAAVTAAVAAIALPLASAECPKGCSGRGECNTFDSCDCYAGYSGSDCSLRTCPSAMSFVDTPRGDLNHDGVVASSTAASSAYSKTQWSLYKQYEVWPTVADTLISGKSKYKGDGLNANTNIDPTSLQGGGWKAQADEAHFYSECSGKGLCDRTLGVCKCFDGYEGGACQRTKCPNDCSGHGTCTKVADLASGGFYSFSDSVNRVNSFEGVTTAFTYNLWDGEKNTKCVCDAGYTGSDCSMRICARGDDPLTVATPVCGNADCTPEVQGFTINGNSANDKKTYRIKYFDYEGVAYFTNAFPIRVRDGSASADENSARLDANEDAVKGALESLPHGVTGNLTVDCNWDKTSVYNIRCTVTFKTLGGNLPEFIVEAITGAPPVAQPSQPVHELVLATPASADAVKISLFPLDMNGFRTTEFSSTGSVTAGTNAVDTTFAASIASALQDRAKGVAAFVYKHGITGATLALNNNYLTIVMPSKMFGANKMKLYVGTAAAIESSVDTKDGNKEASLCSNRGLCDYSSGLCKCFTGYTGKACEGQSVLAM